MRGRGWGRIICLTSLAALQPAPNLILSTTARAGVHGFAKALSDEVAAEGVTINCVAPGFIGTERLSELFDDDKRAELGRQIPAGRIGEPAEVAAAVAFLASEPARYITGSVVRVDGGACYQRAESGTNAGSICELRTAERRGETRRNGSVGRTERHGPGMTDGHPAFVAGGRVRPVTSKCITA